jgi:GxxExxY protein
VEILYDKLSYQIIGSAFSVFNEIGFGHLEKVYQKALEQEFFKRGLKFKREFYVPILYSGKTVGQNYLDFLVEDKIIVEIKRGNFFSLNDIAQIKKYLVATNLQLAILIIFTEKGVRQKRIINLEAK